MNFINPKTDFAFKRIFGSATSAPILRSFLNAFLYDSNDIIQSVIILDPYLAPKIRGMKDTFVDVQATLDTGAQVIIEMQVLNVEGFEKRILYNAAKKYSTQLVKGEQYEHLTPVIALTITDFIMFDKIESLKTHFILKEKDFLFDYIAQDIELVFIELPKFTKELDELETLAEKWLYFMRFAPRLDAIPNTFRAPDTALEQALVLANRMQFTLEELDDIEKREMYITHQRGAITKGYNDGRKKGREEGREEGVELGKHKQALETAHNLLPLLDDETIAKSVGLSVADIQQLRTQ
jgi:predicted transposase/invertase (TIGR01784 family)